MWLQKHLPEFIEIAICKTDWEKNLIRLIIFSSLCIFFKHKKNAKILMHPLFSFSHYRHRVFLDFYLLPPHCPMDFILKLIPDLVL